MKRVFAFLLSFLAASMAFAGTKTVTFDVRGWNCGSCAASTRIALKKLDGVEDVKADHRKMEATVTYDDAKSSPAQMIQTIERLGYKATVQPSSGPMAASANGGKDMPANAPIVENVSFFEVPLECGAAKDLGCGLQSKPILKALGRDSQVTEAKINRAGTVLAVKWKNPEKARAGVAVVEAAFKERDLETALLKGPARDKALKGYESERWYGAADVDRLSEREAEVIAARLVTRANSRLRLSLDRAAALEKDLTVAITRRLTAEGDESCARDPLEIELTKVAGKHLNKEQLAELRKAAEQGAGALPGEEE
jgi:copper chaperone CopZ